MILLSITAGGKTFYITDIANGVTYNSQWYDPWILDSTDISWGGGAYASLQLGSISVITGKTNDNGDSLKDIQSYTEWSVNVKWTSYNLSDVTDVFTGVAILRDKNQFTFELKFKEEDFRNENYNLLTPAPNLIINGGEYQGVFDDNTAITVTGESLRVSFALGTTFLAPLNNQSIISGTVSITNITKSISISSPTDYTLDYASGVITVNDTANVDDGDVLSINYNYSKFLANAVVYSSGVYYQNTKTDGGHSVSPPTAPWSSLTDSQVFSDGRSYPIAFGVLGDSAGTYTGRQGFFARPLLLNQTKYLYWSAYGDVKKVFDDGVEVAFTKKSDNIFQLSERPVGEVSMFVNGDIAIVPETVAGKARKLQTTTYHVPTEPTSTDYDLIIGDIWYDTSTDIQYKWNGYDWDIIIEEVKKVIKGSSIEYGSPDIGLNISQDYLGYYSGTLWNAYIQKTGSFYFGDGGTTIGTNKFLAFYNASNGIRGAGTPDTFVISTSQFKVDASGNATFSGALSAASGRFLGDVSFLNDSGVYYSKRILLKSFPDGNSLPIGGLISYPTGFVPYNSTGSTDNRFSSATDNFISLTTTGKNITVGSKEYQLAFTIVKTGSANPIDYYIEIVGYQTLNRTTTGLYSFTSGVEFYINFLTSQSIEVYVPKAWYVDFSGNSAISFYMYDNNSAGTFTTTEYGINFMAVNE
jgi:hypothetical protein